MSEMAQMAGIIASLLAAVGLCVLAGWAVTLLRAPKRNGVNDAELNEIEGYAVIREELSAIRNDLDKLSRMLNVQHGAQMETLQHVHLAVIAKRPSAA